VRFVRTEQQVGGLHLAAGSAQRRAEPAETAGVTRTSTRRSTSSTPTTTRCPSATAALTVAKNTVLRASASRTMTRADPNALRPGINFSSPSADTARSATSRSIRTCPTTSTSASSTTPAARATSRSRPSASASRASRRGRT
jgi:hypothetical protein